MPGSVTNKQQGMPAPAGLGVAGATIAGTGDSGLDGGLVLYACLLDANTPASKVPLASIAQDGTDSTDAGALQGTAGVGLRGWLSTLVSMQRAQTAILSSVAGATTSQTVLGSNARRKGVSVYNEGPANLYVAYAPTASTTAYTVRVPPYEYWEMDPPIYVGQISGLWDALGNNARVTEKS